MGKNEVYLLFLLISFSVSILLTVWLVKRGKPERRIHWFIGCSVFSMFLLGIRPRCYTPIARYFSLFKKGRRSAIK